MKNEYALSSYDYQLPDHLIAQEPSFPAHRAKLLICEHGKDEKFSYQKGTFESLPDFLGKDDVLFFNETKVFRARIPLHKTRVVRGSGKERIIENGEIFVYQIHSETKFECLVSDDKNFRPGSQIFFPHGIVLSSKEFSQDGILFEIGGSDIFSFLEEYGDMPLPPYIAYEKEKEKRYQTDFAKTLGSAAAPTASLHFTQELLEKLKKKGVGMKFSLLHVGLGTFKPVYADDITQHNIHEEPLTVQKDIWETIWKIQQEGKKSIAVGTTMVRLLETLPYLWKMASNEDLVKGEKEAVQRFWNSLGKDITDREAEKFVRKFEKQKDGSLEAMTKIFIFPGFKFRVIDEIITNFHLPKTSLLMLVSAFMGKNEALQAYHYAIEENFRFYSFGDGMWIRKKT